jgi:SAM-dependent methyltransferase
VTDSWKTPFRYAKKVAILASRKLRGDTFSVGRKEYHYLNHPYLLTFQTERALELPIALECMKEHQGERILEVGNTLSHYLPVIHDIVDKYEIAEGVINQDIVDYKPKKKYDLIICISTLEHIGWDAPEERDGMKTLKAVKKFRTLLNPGGVALMTFPVGCNPCLDKLVASGRISFDEISFLKRISWDNRWVEVSIKEGMKLECGRPFKGVNGFAVGRLKR